MHKLDGHRPLAYRRGHALDRAGAYVAGGEDARCRRLQEARGASYVGPAVLYKHGLGKGVPCGNEAVLAQRYIAVEPARMRGRADENEQRAKVESSLCGMRGCSSYEKGSTSIHMLSPEKVASTDPFSSKSRRDIARTGNIFADLSATFKIEKAPFKRY